MNFDDTPQEAAFRTEAKAWISANAPKQYEEELRKSSLGRTALKGANILEVAKAWQKKKADAGWACLHWPKEYGGRGSSPIERVIWQQEEGPFGKLSGMFIIGHGMCRRGAEAQISATAGLGRKGLVSAVLRTRRWF
jgi:alkylation response protein AidB-like acyl-CoA dehydrogenase